MLPQACAICILLRLLRSPGLNIFIFKRRKRESWKQADKRASSELTLGQREQSSATARGIANPPLQTTRPREVSLHSRGSWQVFGARGRGGAAGLLTRRQASWWNHLGELYNWCHLSSGFVGHWVRVVTAKNGEYIAPTRWATGCPTAWPVHEGEEMPSMPTSIGTPDCSSCWSCGLEGCITAALFMDLRWIQKLYLVDQKYW